jgi:hypothetical protein
MGKAASVLGALGRGASTAAGGVTRGVGATTWHAAKALGGGTPQGAAAVLGGGTIMAGTTLPKITEAAKQQYADIRAIRTGQKGASTMSAVLDNAYSDLAAGRISDRDVKALEGFEEVLSKESFDLSSIPILGSVLGNPSVQHGAAVAAGGLVAAAAAAGVARGVSAAAEALTFAADYQAMIKAHPQLTEYPPDRVKAVFNTLRHMNLAFSKDPLIAGSFVYRSLQNTIPEHPEAMPEVSIGAAKELAQASQFLTQAAGRGSAADDAFAQAIQSGAKMHSKILEETREARTHSQARRGSARPFTGPRS